MTFNNNLYEGENICAWEQSILATKDFNIPVISKNKQVRNFRKSTMTYLKKINNNQQIQNIDPSNNYHINGSQTIQDSSYVSNINLLKKRMKILEENNDRWQQSISNYPIGMHKKRIMSGFIKPNVQSNQDQHKQVSSMRILSKSTQHYQQKRKLIRPSTGVSRNQSNVSNQTHINNPINKLIIQRAKTIHQRSSRPSSSKQKIRCSNFIHKAINININQLQSSKMQKILKYLNKHK